MISVFIVAANISHTAIVMDILKQFNFKESLDFSRHVLLSQICENYCVLLIEPMEPFAEKILSYLQKTDLMMWKQKDFSFIASFQNLNLILHLHQQAQLSALDPSISCFFSNYNLRYQYYINYPMLTRIYLSTFHLFPYQSIDSLPILQTSQIQHSQLISD